MWRICRAVAFFGVVILIGIATGYLAGSDEQVEQIKEYLALTMVGLGVLAALLYGFAHAANRFMKQRDRKDTFPAASEAINEKELP